MTSLTDLPVSEQLARILASPGFARADRLRQFLAFVVDEALAGRAAALKEYTVATRVFGKETGFDPRTDPIVRVQARRLRAKLERYYATEGLADPVVIELPLGGYAPVIRPSAATGPIRRERPMPNLTAQNFYRQGRYHLDQRTEEGLTRAVTCFERAIAEDAQYALAHAGLADAYGLLGHYGALGPSDVWPRTAAAATTAVQLDDQSAETQTSLAHVRATQDWDWTGAEAGYRKAIALDPRYTTAHHWYAASCLVPLRRLDDALAEMTLAQSLDPVSSIIARDLAMVHCYRRDYDAALEQCDHTIELNPYFAPGYWSLGIVQEQRGDLDESAAAFQRAVQLSPRTPRLIAALGRAQALAGRSDDAIGARRSLEALAAERYVSPLEFAWIELGLGELDGALAWLARAFDERAFDLIAAHVDPRFDQLRGEERFAGLTSKLGL
jgi:tetratricopeptide (TPR) repeat protein